MRDYVFFQRAMGKTYLNDKYAVDDESGWIISKPAAAKSEEELASFATDLQKLSKGLAEKYTLYLLFITCESNLLTRAKPELYARRCRYSQQHKTT